MKVSLQLFSLLTIAICALAASAQDKEMFVFEGSFTAEIDGTCTPSGLNFWVKGYEPFQVMIMGASDIVYTGRAIGTENNLPDDDGYIHNNPIYWGDIVIPNNVYHKRASYDVYGISYGTFSNCNTVTSVTLPNRLQTIGRGAFYGCSALTEVTQTAFRENKSDSGPCNFFPDIFKNCTKLAKADISIADYIWGGIFMGCISLSEVTMTTTHNQLNAFRNRQTPSLTKIVCKGMQPGEAGDYIYFFDQEFEQAEVIVPAGALNAYRSHPVWGRFQNLHE